MESVVIVIISACSLLVSDPRCKDFELPPFVELNAIQCIIGVQAQVAKLWTPSHPNWIIRKITCKERHGLDEVATEADI